MIESVTKPKTWWFAGDESKVLSHNPTLDILSVIVNPFPHDWQPPTHDWQSPTHIDNLWMSASFDDWLITDNI